MSFGITLLASLSAPLCCSESVDSEFRICEFIPETACALLRVFFLYSESISGLDALHIVFNCGVCAHLANRAATDSFSWSHDPYTLAFKARPSLTDVGLLSVSLSLSLSLSFAVARPLFSDTTFLPTGDRKSWLPVGPTGSSMLSLAAGWRFRDGLNQTFGVSFCGHVWSLWCRSCELVGALTRWSRKSIAECVCGFSG